MATKRRRRKRKPPRIRHRAAPGTLPGTLNVDRLEKSFSIELMRYDRDTFEEKKITDIDSLAEELQGDSICWVNVYGLGDASAIERLGRLFKLHPLALEDVVNIHQRSKIEDYDNTLFIVMRMVALDDEHNLSTEQLSLFLGKNFVLTFQERLGDCLDPVRDRIRFDRGKIRKSRADYLAYALIDTVIDAYFPVVDHYGEKMEQLDEEVTSNQSQHFMGEVHNVRGDLVTLRRVVRPFRDTLIVFVSDPHELFEAETRFYLRDCYDHVVQLIELLDNYREMCSDLRDYYLSIVNNRMNEVMKVLTIIGTIFIPLGFIAGVYGMNFNTALPGNMPELNWPYGYPFAIGLMATVAGGVLVFAYRRGWLS